MALLGTLVDKTVGKVLSGNTLTTVPHGLGAAPDEIRLQMRSIDTTTAFGAVIAPGGSASFLTVGLVAATIAAGSNLACVDVFAQTIHSLIR